MVPFTTTVLGPFLDSKLLDDFYILLFCRDKARSFLKKKFNLPAPLPFGSKAVSIFHEVSWRETRLQTWGERKKSYNLMSGYPVSWLRLKGQGIGDIQNTTPSGRDLSAMI